MLDFLKTAQIGKGCLSPEKRNFALGVLAGALGVAAIVCAVKLKQSLSESQEVDFIEIPSESSEETGQEPQEEE